LTDSHTLRCRGAGGRSAAVGRARAGRRRASVRVRGDDAGARREGV